ncbi:MAG: hypothetical protein MJY87_06915 [Fibrobacter sp.]|nr:hypothetical protein [Fibrobacter sp.]
MCNFIGIEYLAALALIVEGKKDISLSDLNNYGIEVMKVFKQDHIDAVFLFSSKYAFDMVQNYSDCFELIENDTILHLKGTNEDLISKFLAYLSADVLAAAQKVKAANVG